MWSFFKHSKKKPSPISIDPEEKERDPALLERSLQAVYFDAKGKVPDLGTLERTPSWRWLWMIGLGSVVCIMLAGGIWAGILFVDTRQERSTNALSLRIEGPSQVSLGEEQTYTYMWKNEDLQPLYEADIRLNLPADFTLTHLEPSPSDMNLRVWKLGTVNPQAQGKIEIKGFFVGSLGGQTALQGLSRYQKARLPTSSQQAILKTVSYTGTVLAGNILLPERMMAGEPLRLRYVIANLGKQPIPDLWARLLLPAGFIPAATPTSTTLDLTERRATFPIGTLAPNTFYTAELSGTLASGLNGEAVFQAETGRKGMDEAFLVAARSEVRTAIAPGDLVIRLVANGSDMERSIEPGEPVRVTLEYQNVSIAAVRDVQISLQAESVINGKSATGTSLLNWGQIDDPVQGTSTTKSRIQTLTYDKKQLPTLNELVSQSQGSIEVSWPTLSTSTGTKDAFIRLTALVRVNVTGEKTARLIRSQPVTLRYRTDADIDVQARYFSEEGAPLGSGPLPPVAGKTTNYRIYWRLRKRLHELSDTRISATLPKIVAWTGKQETGAGVLNYDETTRKVTWNIGQVTEATNEVEGWFEVAMTPQPIDIGRFAALVGETSFQTKDVRLNEIVTRTKPSLSTDLIQDEGARGKGVVRKEEK